ncbi:TNFAIP3-interacting protein 3-like [Plectropomus leopardus]|uniref:TNFAIP3-interacting protein 3-like n=1 Tax=Plectropomus leopardus TaxID=160734 RepID=UPI001C4B4CC4|nr:TNFAIP3-interacting protein 3-like [Plectropomus leopardus]
MSRTQENTMSLHENTMDQLPAERSQTSDNRLTHRLYPSLPNIDSVFRYDGCVADPATGEKPHTAAVTHPDSLQGDTQSEVGGSSDVRMKAQILILEEQRQELLSINEKWAREYRTMVQYYKQKVRDLKEILQHNNLNEDMRENEDRDDTLHKKDKDKEMKWGQYTQTGDKLLKAEREAEELRAQNSTLTRRGQHQHEEIRRLNKALEEALQTTQPLDVSSETLQDVWKQQAEVYKEDFLKERRDREKLKEKCLEQDRKFRKVYNELRVLKSQVSRTRPPQPALECCCTNQATNWEVRQINQNHIQLQRRYTLNDKP